MNIYRIIFSVIVFSISRMNPVLVPRKKIILILNLFKKYDFNLSKFSI